jgi:hypothetical protein
MGPPMRTLFIRLIVLGVGLFVLYQPTAAQAQATRTWVSGVGDDANPCSRTAPCKTWAGAITKTTAGGEIDALDPGGFGALTITKSITLDGGGGQVASVLTAGTPGITVAAGSNDVVVLRNLTFQGLLGNGTNPGSAGTNGINFTSGAELVIDNCNVNGFNTNGLNVALSATGVVMVRNSTFRNNAGYAVAATTSSGFALVQISNSSVVGTLGSGGPAQGGVSVNTGGFVTVSNSTFEDLNIGALVIGNGTLSVDNSLFTTTSTAIATGAGTTLNVNNNSFYANSAVFSVSGSATSAGNNKIVGAVGVFSPTPMTQQ